MWRRRVCATCILLCVVALELQARQLSGDGGPPAGAGANGTQARRPRALSNVLTIGSGNASWTGEPHIISWSPFVMQFDDFLTPAECQHLLTKAEPLMEPALLVRNNTQHFKSPRRTSRGAFFDRGEDAVIAAVDARIAHATLLPAENAEPLQVMTYGKSEQYTAHVDFYSGNSRYFGKSVDTFGGQRIATVLLYLTTCDGGETVFPHAKPGNAEGKQSCAATGVGVKAVQGRMIVFHNTLPNGAVDGLTTHQSCPVLKGRKTVISRFIRSDACRLNKNFSKRKWNGNVECVDDRDDCGELARDGACKSRDPARRLFMVGDARVPGFCEKTCGACSRPVEPSVRRLRQALALKRWLQPVLSG